MASSCFEVHFLKISGFEHFFMCLSAISSFSWENIQVLCLFLRTWLVSVVVELWGLAISGYNPYQIVILNIFSCFMVLPFRSVNGAL